jgi:hypothetical protein
MFKSNRKRTEEGAQKCVRLPVSTADLKRGQIYANESYNDRTWTLFSGVQLSGREVLTDTVVPAGTSK